MIKNYQSLGILLDSSCHKILNELYSKIKNQIFPKQKKEHKNSIKYDENSPNIINTTKSIFNTEENNKENILKTAPIINDKIEEEKVNTNTKSVNEYILNKKILGSIKINDENKYITDKYKTIKPSTKLINADPIEAIPLLYNICVKYIIDLFKLEKVNFNLLKGIGICKIFRDHFNKIRGKKNKIHWMVLIQNLENLVPEVVINLMRKIALDNKDSDGNITLQFYFSKLEQILLQYNLSLEDEKNLARYYV